MIKIKCLVAMLFFATTLYSQQNLKIKIIHADTRESLPAASIEIKNPARTITADSTGMAVLSLPAPGKYSITVSYAGYQEVTVTVSIPYAQELLTIEMEPEEEEEEEVIIQSTRTSRTIRNVPTRIETIAMEEIDEKANMRPANVSMLLHESTGIQVQQTSATSANASIRIQGLDGRYTQLLKDGFASFGNFASGLSVLEIPPLDLRQVEIIKGPASPLYGGGAIAGVVNFVSRTPNDKPEHNLLFNQSSVGQSNLGFFASKRNSKTGYTLLALFNHQLPFDVDKDDFTELPKTRELTLHPRLFLYAGPRTTVIFGNSMTAAVRKGGDMQVIRGKADSYHRYFENNQTIRNITTLELQRKITDSRSLNIKQGFSVFDRHIETPDHHFDGISFNSFTDMSYLVNLSGHSLVIGANGVYDDFREKSGSSANRDNRNVTAGTYIQDTWDATERIKLESGIRFDYARYSNSLFRNSEFFVLPRISLLVQYSEKLSSRIGGGLGYKLPTLFTERTEALQYQDVLQLNQVKAERSYGGTADVNLKTRIGHALDLSFNQLFFYTRISRPLVMQLDLSGYSFANNSKPVESMGFETNMKFIYRHDYKLFLGYTYTDAQAEYLPGNRFLPLVAKHKFNSALIYEKHGFLKMGLEAYYTSPQFLYNGFRTSGYWELGFMAEKLWKKFSLFINFENFTDTRQSRFKRVVNDPHNNPVFDDIWTHTEGFVVNGGIKIKW